MRNSNSRRTFLRQGAAAGALAGLGDLGFLSRLTPVSAAEAHVDHKSLALAPEIEPIVRFIEETPRDQLLEETASRIRGGLSYRELLAGLLLAGVKNIEPRPSVGHKFHAVLVVNSAHLASLASPEEHRWLPIFWALDNYKAAAARDVEERGDWQMEPVEEAAVPSAREAANAFDAAMKAWDEPAADAAIVGLARSAGAARVYEHLFRYGMRDFRSIGHKAIYTANSLRTLNCIGWRHAEPVLRSLSYALLANEGSNPRSGNEEADRPWQRNQELAPKIRADWTVGKQDAAARTELLETLRTGSNDESCDAVVELLNRGTSPQSLWDAMHLAAGEYLLRQPGIVALHAVTTTNALRFAFETSGEDETRRLALLQNAAFLPMFRGAMNERGEVKEFNIDAIEPAGGGDSPPALDAIFAKLGDDRAAAAGMTLGRLEREGGAQEFIDAARVLTFLKGNDAHDYKFSSAVLEDYYNVSADVRNRYLASSVVNLCSSLDDDNTLVQRTRSALGATS